LRGRSTSIICSEGLACVVTWAGGSCTHRVLVPCIAEVEQVAHELPEALRCLVPSNMDDQDWGVIALNDHALSRHDLRLGKPDLRSVVMSIGHDVRKLGTDVAMCLWCLRTIWAMVHKVGVLNVWTPDGAPDIGRRRAHADADPAPRAQQESITKVKAKGTPLSVRQYRLWEGASELCTPSSTSRGLWTVP